MDTLTGGNLVSFTAAARHFGVRNHTIADLVIKLGIKAKPISTNAAAKGLDESDIKKLARVLGPEAVAASTN